MSEIIDAKGLACPQPVLLVKKALDVCDEVTVLVDNKAARDNVKRMAEKAGCAVDVKEEQGAVFSLQIKRQQSGSGEDCKVIAESASAGIEQGSISSQTVFVISSDLMGQGSDELGTVLMKVFLHTTSEMDCPPSKMIFYNAGVKLTAADSDVIDDLKALEGKGTELMICGTCVNYFKIGDRLGAGKISNMFDIIDVLSTAGRIVRP
jgi:selenium metabolism protein YedF